MKKQSFSANKLKMTVLAMSMLAASQASWAATYYSKLSGSNYTSTTSWSSAECGMTPVDSTALPTATDSIVVCTGHTVTLDAGSVTVANLELAGTAPILALGANTLTVTGDTKISTTSNAAITGTGKVNTTTLTINAAVPTNTYFGLISVAKDLNLSTSSSLTVSSSEFTIPETINVMVNSTLIGAGTVGSPIGFTANNLNFSSAATLTLKGGVAAARVLLIKRDITLAADGNIAPDGTTAGSILLVDDNHTIGTTGKTLTVTAPFSIPAPVQLTRFININGTVDLKGITASTSIITAPTSDTKGFGFVFGSNATLVLPSSTAGTLVAGQFTTGANVAYCDLYNYINTSIKTGTTPTALTITAPSTLQSVFCNAPTKTAPYIAPVYINSEKAKTFAETK